MDFDALTGAFAAVPTDWIILGSITLVAAFDIVRSGARRVCVAALALPVSLLIFATAKDAMVIGGFVAQLSTPLMQAALIGGLFVVAFALIGRLGLSWGDDYGQAISAALGGVAFAVLVATFWVATPVLDSLWIFGPQIQQVFGESYRFFWLLGGYGTLAYIRY